MGRRGGADARGRAAVALLVAFLAVGGWACEGRAQTARAKRAGGDAVGADACRALVPASALAPGDPSAAAAAALAALREDDAPEARRLAGVQGPVPGAAAGTLADSWAGEGGAAWGSAATGTADRWGRVPVVVVAGGAVLNAVVLREGLAAFRPGDVPPGCARQLLREEAAARTAGRGEWGEGGSLAVLAAEDAGAIGQRLGRFAIVQGRVSGIGQAGSRVYLNFGARRAGAFAAFVARRSLRRFEAAGVAPLSLEGRSVRLRGVPEEGRGPLMELSMPDQVELVE